MSRLKPIQMNFTSGEWSPRLHGRSDLAKYYNAVETLENFIILPQGGVTRAPGFHFVAAAKYPNSLCRLAPFEFSVTQAYILEFGHHYIRFYKDHGQILSAGVPYEIATPYDEAHLFQLDISTQSADVLYIFHPSYPPAKLSRTGHTAWTISNIVWTDGPYLNEQTTPTITPSALTGTINLLASTDLFVAGHIGALFSITHEVFPFAYSNSGAIDDTPNWAQTNCTIARTTNPGQGQAGDNYYYTIAATGVNQRISRQLSALIIGKNYKVIVYLKDGTGTWAAGSMKVMDALFTTTLGKIDVSAPLPWGQASLVFTAIGTTAQLIFDLSLMGTLTALLDTITVQESPAVASLVTTGYVTITAVTDARNATATVNKDLGSTDPSTRWKEGAWSTHRGFPGTCAFLGDRLFAGGSTYRPDTLWGSKATDYENMTAGTEDDAALIYPILCNQVNVIRWISATGSLLVGSAGGESRVTSGSDAFLSPTNVGTKPETPHGSAYVSPLRIGNALLFVQRSGRKLREMLYDFATDTHNARDVTILAEHITQAGILQMTYQQEPDSMIWCATGSGGSVLLHLSYLRDEEIMGWGRRITDGVVESVATIPDPTGTFNEVWASVKRTIGGQEVRYIEYMDPTLMVDSGITYSGSPVASVSGLSHLEGKTVDIVGDGSVYPQKIVSAGAVPLQGPAASEIQVGLHYRSRLITMQPNFNFQAGTTAGMPKKWSELWVSLLQTCGVMINGESIPFRKVGDPVGQTVQPFTGIKKVSQLGWGDGRVVVDQDLPLPCTVRGIFGTLEIGD